MTRTSLDMRLAVQEIHVNSWHEAINLQHSLEEKGYFCSFMKKKGGFIVYFWF